MLKCPLTNSQLKLKLLVHCVGGLIHNCSTLVSLNCHENCRRISFVVCEWLVLHLLVVYKVLFALFLLALIDLLYFDRDLD